MPLDEDAVKKAARQLAAEGVESVAVVFLFSYRDPAHEQRAAEIVARELPAAAVSASHRITQEWREYERTSTTVVNAYIQPVMDRYLGAFGRALGGRGFRGQVLVTQSNGGAFSLEAARSKPVHTMESGPAAGATGCASLARILGADRLIAFDMGGTTAKCAIVDRGLVQTTDEYHADGHPVRIPVIDIKEVSAGGGTIAWIDTGGALTLGPRSAGADPGPVCYARGGTEPTVTDANVALGRIDAVRFLGGTMPLEAAAGARAIDEQLGVPLGLRRTRPPPASSGSPTSRWRSPSAASRPSAASIRATTRWWRMAAGAPSTPSPWRASWAFRASSSRRRRRRSRRGGCSPPICVTTWCARCSSRWWRPTPRGPGPGTSRCSARSRGSCLPSARP